MWVAARRRVACAASTARGRRVGVRVGVPVPGVAARRSRASSAVARRLLSRAAWGGSGGLGWIAGCGVVRAVWGGSRGVDGARTALRRASWWPRCPVWPRVGPAPRRLARAGRCRARRGVWLPRPGVARAAWGGSRGVGWLAGRRRRAGRASACELVSRCLAWPRVGPAPRRLSRPVGCRAPCCRAPSAVARGAGARAPSGRPRVVGRPAHHPAACSSSTARDPPRGTRTAETCHIATPSARSARRWRPPRSAGARRRPRPAAARSRSGVARRRSRRASRTRRGPPRRRCAGR